MIVGLAFSGAHSCIICWHSNRVKYPIFFVVIMSLAGGMGLFLVFLIGYYIEAYTLWGNIGPFFMDDVVIYVGPITLIVSLAFFYFILRLVGHAYR